MSHRRIVNISRLAGMGDYAPPEPGPWCECPECGGSGSDPAACEDHEDDTCQCCGGTGYVDENGEPFDPAQAERDRDEYADLRRDRNQQEQA